MYEHGYDHCVNLHPCARCSTKKQLLSKDVDGGQQMDATSYTAQQQEDLKEELDCWLMKKLLATFYASNM